MYGKIADHTSLSAAQQVEHNREKLHLGLGTKKGAVVDDATNAKT